MQLLARLPRHGTAQEGLLVAASGGSDSTALLRLAADTRSRHGRPIAVAHVHHGLRPDADEEALRLEALCTRLGLRYRCTRLAPADRDEASLRVLRYQSLRRMADEEGCRFILLGHQHDDQVETVLLHLLRGTGTRGMRGMRVCRGRIVRPLLWVPRAVLQEYLRRLGETWGEDPTNRDAERLRNRIRHELVPLLERLRPGAAKAIARAAAHIAQVDDEIAQRAREGLQRCRLPGPSGEVLLDARRLRGYHGALAVQIIRRAVRIVRGDLADISASLWKGILETHERRRDGRFDMRRGVSVEVTGRAVRVSAERRAETIGPSTEIHWNGTLQIGTDGRVEHRRVSFRPGERVRLLGLSRGQVFDADALRPPLIWRGLEPGDRLRRPHPARSRKISDLLAEMGIPRSVRARQPILEDADGILWVPGVRRADRARVQGSTRRLWIVRWSGWLPADCRLRGGASR